MDRFSFVIYLTLIMGHHSENHAIGFLNERNCWQWVEYFNQQKPHQVWVGYCMPIEEFEQDYPGVELENIET